MKKFWQFITDYFKSYDRRVFNAITLFTGLLIYLNYAHGLEKRLTSFFSYSLAGYFVLFLGAFSIAYLLTAFFSKKNYFASSGFLFLVILAPLLFAIKAGDSVSTDFFENSLQGAFWNETLYWPIRLLFFIVVLYIIHRKWEKDNVFFGLTTKNFTPKPYFLILLFLIPLIVFASTQPDFLATYPKLKNVSAYTSGLEHSWIYNLLYELCYGSDFISIEVFFRGFLVFAFVRYAGKDAILPMACFYCTIHFGKPLFECISSFPGGLLLGIISYNTRSIIGGLIVHLGLAWLMELGGYIGNL